jgi:hypothetical protein
LTIISNRQLTIYILQAKGYVESPLSPTFPNLPITELIPRLVQKAIDDGTSQMLRELRALLPPSPLYPPKVYTQVELTPLIPRCFGGKQEI